MLALPLKARCFLRGDAASAAIIDQDQHVGSTFCGEGGVGYDHDLAQVFFRAHSVVEGHTCDATDGNGELIRCVVGNDFE